MTWRGTAGLGVVLALLVVAIRWVDRRAAAPVPAGGAALLTADPTSVTAFEIHTPATTLRFERDPAGWRSVGDASPAGARNVPGVLTALGSLAPLMVIAEEPETLDDFGLGSDAVRLVALSGAQPVLDLDIGNRNPAWTAIYVRRRDSADVLLVGSLLRWELEKIIPLTLPFETRDPSGSRPAKEAP